MSLSQAYRDAAYPEATGEVFATLITIEHEELPDPVLLTDGGSDIVYATDLLDAQGNVAAKAGTYLAFPIEVVPPGQSDSQPRGTLRVPNVDMAIGALVDAISTPATITVTVVLASDPTDIVGGPHRMLDLSNLKGDAQVVEGEMSRQSLTRDFWPKHTIRQSVFKAAFR